MTLLIAVAARANGQVAPDASRAHHWQVFQAKKGETLELVWTVLAQDSGSLSAWQGEASRHPLASVDAVIAGNADKATAEALQNASIPLVPTNEVDTLQAATHYLQRLEKTVIRPFPKAV